MNALLEPPANVREWACVGAAVAAISFYLSFGVYARQCCELITIVPSILLTLRAVKHLHHPSIRKLIQWCWAGKALFFAANPLLGHILGYYLVQAIHLCPLLFYISLRLRELDQRDERAELAAQPSPSTRQPVAPRPSDSVVDRDTREITLSTADRCSAVESAKIFSHPPDISGSAVSLKDFGGHMADLRQDGYYQRPTRADDDECSSLGIQTAGPWGDSIYERYQPRVHDIVINQIVLQERLQIRVNNFHPSPHIIRVFNTLNVPVMYKVKVNNSPGLSTSPTHGIVEAGRSGEIDLSLPVSPGNCRLAVDVLPTEPGKPFDAEAFHQTTPLRYPVNIVVE